MTISREDFMKLSDEDKVKMVINNVSTQLGDIIPTPHKSDNYGLSEYEINFNRHNEIITELRNVVQAIKDLTDKFDRRNF